jgi:phage terminase large subunit GpA-like protein
MKKSAKDSTSSRQPRSKSSAAKPRKTKSTSATRTLTRASEAIRVTCAKVAQDLLRCFRVIKAPERLSISQWAAKHARLKDGTRYHPWPFQIGILDELNNPRTTKVTLMKSSRVGYTQILLAYIGYRIAHDPGNLLLARPTIEDTKKFMKKEVGDVIRWPIMKTLGFARSVSGSLTDTITEKYFPGGWLKGIGANSPGGFRDHDADATISDEIDGWPVVAGLDGDQLALIEVRLEQSHDPKDIAGSTPTEESVSKIYKRFLDSDQRHYWVKCKTCSAMQKLVWGHGKDNEPGLRWEPFEAPQKVWYQCVNGCEIPESEKLWMLEHGEWRAEKPEVYERTGHAGFHINSLYSLQNGARWKKLAERFVEQHGKPATFKAFVNTRLGEVWRVKGEAPDWKRLYDRSRAEDRPSGKVPYGACYLTCAIDVQAAAGGRLEIMVYGHGRGGTTYPVEQRIIAGSPFETDTWAQAEAFCRGKWEHANGEMLGIFKAAVDVGYATLPAYRFCKKMGLNWFMPVRGSKLLTAPPIAASTAMELTGKTGKKLKSEVRVHLIGGHVLKQELYGNLNLEFPTDGKPFPLGYVHLPSWFSEEMCKQIVAEEWIAEKNDWIKRHPANEQLDLWVYNRAAAIAAGADKWTEAEWAVLEAQYAAPGQEVSAPEEDPEPVQQAKVEPEPSRRDPEPVSQQRRTDDWLGGSGGDDWLRR